MLQSLNKLYKRSQNTNKFFKICIKFKENCRFRAKILTNFTTCTIQKTAGPVVCLWLSCEAMQKCQNKENITANNIFLTWFMLMSWDLLQSLPVFIQDITVYRQNCASINCLFTSCSCRNELAFGKISSFGCDYYRKDKFLSFLTILPIYTCIHFRVLRSESLLRFIKKLSTQ